MKKIFAGLIMLATVFTFSASAQAPQTKQEGKKAFSHGRSHRHHEMMLSQLNLTEDQKKQLKADNEDYKKQLQALNKNENITVKESRDKKYALKKERKQKLMALLTTEQKAKLEQLKQQKEQQRQQMADQKLDKMKAKLGLSDDQVAQIKDQRKTTHDKLKAIKENDKLSRTEKKQQLDAVKNDSKESFKKILTPDQLNKMEEMKKARKSGVRSSES